MRLRYVAAALTCALFVLGNAQAKPDDTENKANKPADNTGKNVRDRSSDAVTSGDQSNSKEDIDITRKIRRAIVKKDGLSTSAKNVKIVTANGKVTLRGPVKSSDEKEQIASAAKEVAGVASVDNQLEVKESNEAKESK
jgi:hyperosmotically inducible protein